MELEDILQICDNLLASNLSEGTTKELVEEIRPIGKDSRDLSAFLVEVELHVRNKLNEKIEKAFMDMTASEKNLGEALMFRLRLENAVFILSCLCRKKDRIACHLDTELEEEAACWALSSLWEIGGVRWLHRTADALCRGSENGLECK